jgi:hypothetical protein
MLATYKYVFNKPLWQQIVSLDEAIASNNRFLCDVPSWYHVEAVIEETRYMQNKLDRLVRIGDYLIQRKTRVAQKRKEQK